MFSVIIPLYNKAPYIKKAIYSVLNQTCQDFELIVVNDGSTDNSPEIVRQINQLSNKPFNIFDQSNAGVSTARNNGVQKAKNDYIAFLDADDWWDPSYLAEMKQLIEAYPDAGIYAAKYAEVKHGKKREAVIGLPEGFSSGYINYFEVYAKTMWMPLFPSSAILPRRLFLDFKGFKPEIKLGEDFELWVRVVLQYPVAFLNKVLVFYNQEVDSQNKATGAKFYSTDEHMIFKDYGELRKKPEFQLLYEKLALYSLLKYYSAGKNLSEIGKIMSCVDWNKHPFKYRFYYRILPRKILHLWLVLLKLGSRMKYIVKEYYK